MSANKPKTAALMATPQDIEAQFYEALQRGDIEALMAVWSDDEDIVCVHPGGPRIVGAAAIRATFDSIFANGPISVHPEKLRTVNTGHCAVHNLMERVDHSLSAEDLTAVGRDVECVVLARAVRWHVQRRVLMNGHKTVVFR